MSARRLAEWGAVVQLVLANESDRLSEVTGHQLAILERVGVPYTVASDDAVAIPADGMVIDVLVGYSLSGGLRGAAAALIHEANGTAASRAIAGRAVRGGYRHRRGVRARD